RLGEELVGHEARGEEGKERHPARRIPLGDGEDRVQGEDPEEGLRERPQEPELAVPEAGAGLSEGQREDDVELSIEPLEELHRGAPPSKTSAARRQPSGVSQAVRTRTPSDVTNRTRRQRRLLAA